MSHHALRKTLLLPLGASLAGCSPEVAFQGAYFPLWLITVALGIVATLVLRMVLIKLHIDEGIPFRSLVYLAFAAFVAFIISASVLGY